MAKVEALGQRFDKLDKISVNEVGTTNGSCEVCGVVGHMAADCQVEVAPMQELMDVVHNIFDYNYKGGTIIHTHKPTTQVGRTIPISHIGTTKTKLVMSQPSSRPPHIQKSKLEFLLENFVETQTKQNEEFRQHSQAVSEEIKELTSKVDNLAIHSNMLETQISQQACSSSRPHGRFPGQPEVNPNEHCNAITISEGHELIGNIVEGEGVEQVEVTRTPTRKEDSCEVVEKDENPIYIPPEPSRPPTLPTKDSKGQIG